MVHVIHTENTHPDHPDGAHFELRVGTVWKHYRSKVGECRIADP